MKSRRAFVKQVSLGLAGVTIAARTSFAASTTQRYVCPPCGCAADGKIFDRPGKCPACGMTLVAEAEYLPFEPRMLEIGAGAFLAAGGIGREAKHITVHYYKPSQFSPQSPILIVLPGAGRNAGDYRDVWLAASERSGALVAALGYPEEDYDFAAYQMGGVIKNLQIRNIRPGPDGQPPSVVYLNDEDISFDVNPRPGEWLFNDFDRIFDMLVTATGSAQSRYDLFGHSAGGQISHRLPLFHPGSRAGRIVAANAGLYTLPTFDLPQPMGLKDTGITSASLKLSLAANLIVLLGESDNDAEVGGIQLHTPFIDRYGIDRLTRGRTFFQSGQERAHALGVPLGWKLETVPKVGHDFRKMSEAAARLLYG